MTKDNCICPQWSQMPRMRTMAAVFSSLSGTADRLQLLRNILRRRPRLALVIHALRSAFCAGREMTMTPYGFRLAGNAAMRSGAFESEEITIVSRLLTQHDRFVDCGANIGFYSCLAR